MFDLKYSVALQQPLVAILAILISSAETVKEVTSLKELLIDSALLLGGNCNIILKCSLSKYKVRLFLWELLISLACHVTTSSV